jgi:hypothetical protein
VTVTSHLARRGRAVYVALAMCAALAACGRSAGMGTVTSSPRYVSTRALLRTVPETTAYMRTSPYADVVRFLELLRYNTAGMADPLAFGSIGKTTEGRDIPYVVASRPRVSTPAEARATGKPVVYVQANIHAGEVEGKEALLALLRDLAFANGPNVLDSIVLIAVPIYNADGNEKWGPQEKQRTEQNGPELVGQRANAMGLDLNRDYIKAEAPETRASLAMFNAWDPDVFVDLHTTDGSFHGYALTYSPSLSPAAPLGDYTRELLAELRSRVRSREGFETFDYGNFSDAFGNEVSTDTVHGGWYTYDARPRFGTNYYGLRNRIAVLSEAFSHDPFERRIKSTYAFTRQLLSLVAERGAEIRRHEQSAENAAPPADVALRSVLPKSAPAQDVRYEILARTGDSSRTQPGVPRGIRRTGNILTRPMPVFDRFVPRLSKPLPQWYAIRANENALRAKLLMHGIRMDESRVAGDLQLFHIDSIVRSPRPFQGHNEIRLVGRWQELPGSTTADVLVVRTAQPLGRLAAFLLDPESEDSFSTWNAFDQVLGDGIYPVFRHVAPSPAAR